MYELFVLGELLSKPMHGYLLHKVVKDAIGPVRQMGWSALYPLLQRLEREGLIVREADDSGGGRERKLYRITPAGETRFRALMAEPGEYDADYPDLFALKMTDFHFITDEEKLAILRHYRGYVQYIEDYLVINREHVATEPAIPDMERPNILRSIDHRLYLTRADLQWIDAEIASYTDKNP